MAEELYLNNEQVFLPDRSVALTSQINDIAELKDRQSDYSNKIKIPKTLENIVTMEMLGIAGSKSRLPYIEVSVKYIIDGIERISDGKGIVRNTNNYYNLVIYDGNISIINLLGNSTLEDLDLTSYDHDLTQTNYFASFGNTSGYIYGIGRFYENAHISIIDINLQGVQLYVHTLMTTIFSEAGFTISGDLLSNTDYLSRVVTVDKGYERTDVDGLSTVSTDSSSIDIDEDSWTFLYKEYLVHDYTAAVTSPFNLNISGSVDKGDPEVIYTFVIKIDGLGAHTEPLIDGTFNIDIPLQIENGELIEVYVGAQTLVDDRGVGIDFTTNFTTLFQTNDITTPIVFADIIGDMKQIDFVKDVMQHFGAIYRKTRNSDNYEFKLMETLLFDKANAEDWKDKYVSVANESYTSPYHQTNILKYKYDTPEVESEDDPIYADGEFTIDDLNLPIEKTLFTSNFKASEKFGAYYVAKQWVDNSDDEIEANIDGMRMFKINVVNSSINYRYSPDISGTSVFSGDIPYLDFTDVDYASEVELYYKGIYSMLNDYRKITVNCNLSVIDNYQLDFFKLKYIKQLGQYYYLNKVISFKKDRITRVELVEINEFTPEVLPETLMIARLITDTVVTATLTQDELLASMVANLVTDTIVTATMSLDNVSEEHNNYFNGTFLETFDALITEAGGVVTMTLTNEDGVSDLTMRFSDGYTVFSTPDTITLTVGTDPAPQQNWIYILQSTKVLTKSTSAWPATEHIKIGFFFCQSAANVQVDGGTHINQNWNDESGLTDDGQGHASHHGRKFRALGATYFNGIDPNGTSGYLTITAGNVEFKSTSGIIDQVHPQIFPAFDTSVSSIMHIKNWSGDAYHSITNLHDIVADSTGTTIGTNKWFNLTFWGVQNKSGEYQTIIGNLPSGFYNKQVDAENDVLGYDDFTLPREFNIDSSTGFLIVRITVKKAGTWSYGSAVDLRGTNPQTASGGASGIVTSFVDSQFNIFNLADNTKVVDFDVSNLTTATTRTLTVQDSDGTIAYLSDVTTPDLQAVTNVGNTTTQLIESSSTITAKSSSVAFARLNQSGVLFVQSGTNHRVIISTGVIEMYFNHASNSTKLQFPTSSQDNIATLQDATGTVALLSDLTALTQTLDDVLGEGATSDITIIIENGASTVQASHGQTFFKVDDVTNSISATLLKGALDFEKNGRISGIIPPASMTGDWTWTIPDKTGTFAMIVDTTLQKVLDNDNISTTDITMNSGADIILWSGDATGSKIVINTSLFNMLDSAGTTLTQRSNTKFAAIVGALSSQLQATFLQFQDTNTFTIYPPATISSSKTATFIDASGEVPIWRSSVPASKTASGKKGEVYADANYAYFCYVDNNWIRVAKDGTW